MNKYISTFIIAALMMLSSAFAQNGNKTQILLKGKVTDEFTGKGVEVTMEFRDPDGKKFKINSNSVDGSYQQVFDAGKKYDVIFIGFDVVRKTESVQIDDAGKYKEQVSDFKIKKMTPGLKLQKLNAFQANSRTLNAADQKTIEQLREIMQFNRGVKFELVVNSWDSFKKIAQVKEIKPDKKKAKKGAVPEKVTTFIEPDANQIKALVDSRTEELKKFISGWTKFKDRISVSSDYSAGEPDSENSSVFVIVKEIKNIFE